MSVYLAFTSPINPPGASPLLSHDQVWKGLQRKVEHAEEFVPMAITSTDVLDKAIDETGKKVTTREVIFKDGNRKVKEICVHFEPLKIEFRQPDGTTIQNIISQGADGSLYMTYAFEFLHPGLSEKDLAVKTEQYRVNSKMAVESSIAVIRKMVEEGTV
ncbi:hypothetical protein BGW36DRAFT_352301 [Talaromyces proteolyticus]|uniref:DUF1857-domain-containing protein n=1 Tax=Talaromyces proteolyticus TaxID=1131652 RepID=A0AAD4KI50_9EURO|nr:uncharacterized protein BGW36DRAFT_352301 [Talaromyces proteolyticus]KAH8688988.1 hypothetical protein BGW36DRAFT_352301 [Talaromyces proteolyticus]